MNNKLILLILIHLCIVSVSFAQSSNWQHNFSQLDVNDAIDYENKLWIATDNGLYTIDKTTQQTEHYTTNNSVLTDMHIQTLSKDIAGNLWIGTYDVVLVKVSPISNNLPWQAISYPSTSNFQHVYSSKVDNYGTVWMGTNNGLMSYDGTNWQYYTNPFLSIPSWDIEFDNNNNIQVAGDEFYSFNKLTGVWSIISSPTNTLSFYLADAELYKENDSTTWILPAGGGTISRYQSGQWQQWSSSLLPAPLSNEISTLEIHPNGKLCYAGLYGKVVCFDNTSSTWAIDSSIQHTISSSTDGFQHMLKDDSGDFWLFDQNIALQKTPTTTNSLSFADRKEFDRVTKMIPDKNSNMYLLNNFRSSSIQKITNGVWSNISIPTLLINDMKFDSNNNIWATTYTDLEMPLDSIAILEQNGSSWIIHNNTTTQGVLPNQTTLSILGTNHTNNYNKLAINNNGTIWVVYGLNTIYEYKNNSWSLLNIPSSSSSSTIHHLQTDANSNFWWLETTSVWQMGTYVYIDVIKKYDVTTNTIQEITAPARQTASNIYPMTIDDFGNLYIAPASKNEIHKFDGINWSIDTIPSLINNGIVYPTDLVVDQGKLYVTGYGGFFINNNQSWVHYNTTNSDLKIESAKMISITSNGDIWLKNYAGTSIASWKANTVSPIKEVAGVENSPIKLYPNPVSNYLNIEHEINEKISSLKIINTTGQIIKSVHPDNKTINTSSLPQGAYWVILQTNKNTYTQAFIKK